MQFRDHGVRVTIRPCVCVYCDGLKGHWDLWGRRWQQTRLSVEAWVNALVMPKGLDQIPKYFGKRQRKPKHEEQNLSMQRWINSVMNDYVITLCYIRYCVQFPQISALLVQLKLSQENQRNRNILSPCQLTWWLCFGHWQALRHTLNLLWTAHKPQSQSLSNESFHVVVKMISPLEICTPHREQSFITRNTSTRLTAEMLDTLLILTLNLALWPLK